MLWAAERAGVYGSLHIVELQLKINKNKEPPPTMSILKNYY